MRLLNREALETLMESPGDACISVSMPAERAGAQIRQNRIRFKNLLSEAESELLKADLRNPEAQ